MVGLPGSRSMALTIEGSSLRMLVYSGTKILSWYTAPISPRLLSEGTIASPEGIGEIIAETVGENKLPTKGVVASLPSIGSATQTITVPHTSKRAMPEVVTREIKRSIPSSDDVDYVYWQPMPESRTEEQEIYTLSVPRSSIMGTIDACRAGGINLRGIELKPFSLTRAVGCKNGIIVHGEPDHLEIVIVDDSFPALFRSIPITGGDATTGLAADSLMRELPFTVDYFNRTYIETQLNPQANIYLSGELALDPMLPSELARVSEHDIAPIQPPPQCPLSFPLEHFFTHVGLMLRKNW